MHQTPPNRGAMPNSEPYLRLNRFQGGRWLRRKENSSQDSCRRLRVLLRCRQKNPYPSSGILTRYPFGKITKSCIFQTELPYALGSTNPCPTAVHTEPFSTSVFKVLIWIFATTTKICTRGCFTQTHVQGFFTTPTPSYSLARRVYTNGRVWVTRLSAIHFQG